MIKINKIFVRYFVVIIALFISFNYQVYASPFGVGKYGALVPYGGQTSLTINTSGNIAIGITPTGSATFNSATGTITVVSTDVVGYKLYVRALSTSALVNGSSTIPASSNSVANTLATNTWGYNTDGSSNFLGVSTADSLIKSLTGPAESGDTTSVTYGISVDNTKKAGSYTTTVLYTAVPQTD